MGRHTSLARGPRPFGAAVFALLLLGGGAAAEPYVPIDDAMVLETVPAAGDPIQAELAALRVRVAANPEDEATALALVRRTIEIGRGAADPRYNGYAESALAPWLDVPNQSPEALILMATIEQSRHRFDAALALLDRAQTQAPHDAQAWLTRAVIDGVLGHYDEAVGSCRRLASIADPALVTLCAAGPASLSGRAASAYAALTAVQPAVAADPDLRSWSLTLMAEIAERQGDTAAALDHFREALAGHTTDPYVLGAYGDLLLDLDRPAEVIALLGGWTGVDALLLRVAIAQSRLGDAGAAESIAILADRFAANRRRGDAIHLREEARFALDLQHDPDHALELALANWAIQREPWDSRLVLAAALAAERPDQARAVVRFLWDNRVESVRLEDLIAQVCTGIDCGG